MIVLPSTPRSIALFSSEGEMTVIEDCKEKLRWSPSSKQHTLKQFTFRPSSCTFGQGSSFTETDDLILQFIRRDKDVQVQILRMHNTVSSLLVDRLPVNSQVTYLLLCQLSSLIDATGYP